MAITISMINFKGGVGKTTLTVALAKCLAITHKKKVLLIDLDKQTNATLSLISEKNNNNLKDNNDDDPQEITYWGKNIRDKNKTLYALFTEPSNFDIYEAIQRDYKLGGVAESLDNGKLHFLSSDFRLLGFSDIDFYKHCESLDINPKEVLKTQLKKIKSQYDYILIDCPPNIDIFVENALNCSNHYLTPIFLDKFSKTGLKYLIEAISKRDHYINHLGIIISKYKSSTNEIEYKNEEDKHKNKLIPSIPQDNILTALKNNEKYRNLIFKTMIKDYKDLGNADNIHHEKETRLFGSATDRINDLVKEILNEINKYHDR